MSDYLKTEDFNRKAKLIGDNKDLYGYSNVEYINAKTKVKIFCNFHKEYFEQTPNHHLSKRGCYKCGRITSANKQRGNAEDFIENAILKHGDKFDYSLVVYVVSNSKVKITCKIHNKVFEQTPNNHLWGYDCCTECVNEKMSLHFRDTTETFIEKAKIIHGDLYGYSKVIYGNNAHDVVNIFCNFHKEYFEQTPNNHLNGQGCPSCGRINSSIKQRSNTEEFIENAILIHGYLYDYSKSIYGNNNNENIIIICIKCNIEFEQTPTNHLSGKGCSECGRISSSIKQRSNTEEFIEKAILIHGNKYGYKFVDYVNNSTNVKIECHIHGHGIFEQTPANHLKRTGCPLCINKTEGIVYEKIKQLYPSIITQFKQEWCKNIRCLPFDFCIPEYKIIIELDGPQHFKQIHNWISPEEQFKNDKYKEKCANENNYSVIRITQTDVFYNTYDWEKILCDSIQEIIKSKNVENHYFCKNGEYANY